MNPLPETDRASIASVPPDAGRAAAWLAAIDRSHFLLELDPDGTILYANALFCEALGYSQGELIGRRDRDFLIPAADPPDVGDIGDAVRTYRASDGREVSVRMITCALTSSDGPSARAPMLGIGARSRPEDSGPPSGAGASVSEYPAAGSIDIGRKVRACVEFMRPAAEAKGLSLRCEVDPDLPRWTPCDGLRLRLIVLHLVASAVETITAGWISVCVEPAWNDAETAAISVTATGVGAECAPDGDATGRLGATVSSELARILGGTLTLSERTGGARAELRLPLFPSGRCPKAPSDAAIAIARDPRRDAPRVLVVDDHGIDLARALDQLRLVGARGDGALDGATALAMIAAAQHDADPYRLVLMDMQMRGMDGLEAACRIHASGSPERALPIVALTANAAAATRGRAEMEGHLNKPLEPGSLRYALDRWAPESVAGCRLDVVRPFDRRKQARQAAAG